MKKFAMLIAVAIALTVSGYSQVKVGSKVENFSLPDADGTMRSLADLKGSKGAVLVFVSIQCPVVRGYNERINELAKAYKAKGINLVGVDSNVTEPAADVKAHAMMNWDFPVLLDKDAKIADKFAASVPPERRHRRFPVPGQGRARPAGVHGRDRALRRLVRRADRAPAPDPPRHDDLPPRAR